MFQVEGFRESREERDARRGNDVEPVDFQLSKVLWGMVSALNYGSISTGADLERALRAQGVKTPAELCKPKEAE